jgi:hypothetical protein
MIIIWGSTGREIEIDRGDFHCPACEGKQPYKQVQVANYFTLYFIPLFKTRELGQYVKCLTCKRAFPTDVLDYYAPPSALLIRSVRAVLESGASIPEAKKKLLAGGLDERVADEVVAATVGAERSMPCPSCREPLTLRDDAPTDTEWVKCPRCGEDVHRLEFPGASLPPTDERIATAPRSAAAGSAPALSWGGEARPELTGANNRTGARAVWLVTALAMLGIGVGIGAVSVLMKHGPAWNQPAARNLAPPVIVDNPIRGPAQPPPPFAGVPEGLNPAARMGQRVRLSNPRWAFGAMGSFKVDYEFTNGQPRFGEFYTLKWRYPGGSTGSADVHALFNARGTLEIIVIGIGMGGGNRRGAMEIWMEAGALPGGPFGGGSKISNSVTLN